MKYELNIPENLNDITLEQYQAFLLIENPTSEDLLCTFLNVDLAVVSQLTLTQFNNYVTHINSLFEANQEHQLKFILNGVELGFIPDLDIISYGENKDVTSYINDWQTMHKAMAVLYRPVKQKLGRKYLINDYSGTHEYSELMKQMPLGVVFGAMLFFWNLTNELLNCIPNFLEKEVQRGTMEGQISVENGVHIQNLTRSLRETFSNLMKFQDFHCISV